MTEEPTFRIGTGQCVARADLEPVTGILPSSVIECLSRQGRYFIVTCDDPLTAEAAPRGRTAATRGTAKKAKRSKVEGRGKKRR